MGHVVYIWEGTSDQDVPLTLLWEGLLVLRFHVEVLEVVIIVITSFITFNNVHVSQTSDSYDSTRLRKPHIH